MTEHTIIEPHIKRGIWESQNEKCAYCGRRRQFKHMTVDHIIPLSKGGTDDVDNLQCTCKMCNRLKDNMLPHEFTEFVRCILESSMRIERKFEKSGIV